MGTTPASGRLTPEQHAAVFAQGVSVALSAGAGCGKTLVLTERFLAHLEPGGGPATSLSQIVAISFTDKAAREMRERIRRQCHARLRDASPEASQHWRTLLRQIEQARVSTFHGFCGSLLRAHAVEAELDPHFQVLEEIQAHTLRQTVLDDVLREGLESQDAGWLDLLVEFKFSTLRELVLNLSRMREVIDFRAWEELSVQEVVRKWLAFQQDIALPLALRELSEQPVVRELFSLVGNLDPAPPAFVEYRDNLLELLPRLEQGDIGLEALPKLREATIVRGRLNKKTVGDEDLYLALKDALTKLRAGIDEVSPKIQLDPESAERVAGHALRLMSKVREVVQAYDQAKQDRSALDFEDLMRRAHTLLTDPRHERLQQRIRGNIRWLLVDEFQDTDPLQVELIRALCGSDLHGGKLFFVGDTKQSIYRFRGARPDVFRELAAEMPEAGQLPLARNFRSQPTILQFVNALFQDAFSGGEQPLVPHRPQVSPEPAVEFCWNLSEQRSGVAGAAAQARDREADWIARRLRELLDAGEPIVWDEAAAQAGPPAARASRQGDIAILFRGLSDVQLYEEALQRYSLDYYLVGGHAFYAQQEIFDVLNVLRAIDDPHDTASLAGTLRSPFFSLADESLMWLAQHEDGLRGGLLACHLPEHIAPEERRRVEFASCTLRAWERGKDRLPVAALLQRIMADTGYDAILLGEFLGERKLANLQKLVDQARDFDRGGMFALSDFVARLAELVAGPPREALAATHGEHLDVVRLMTIHQAKGLEFPIVVVPDLNRAPHQGRMSRPYDPKLGPLFTLEDAPEGSSPKAMYRLVEKYQEREEARRLLYVATTRAADYLILSGSLFSQGEEPFKSEAMRYLAERCDWRTGEFRPPLPDEDEVPQIRVSLEPPQLKPPRGKSETQADIPSLLARAKARAVGENLPLPASLLPVAAMRTNLPVVSFSRVSGLLEPAADSPRLETEGAEIASTEAQQRGTLVHAVLADLPMSPLGENDLRSLAFRHAQRLALDDDELITEACKLVSRFQSMECFARMQDAATLRRELEFYFAWPPREETETKCIVRGVIDGLYRTAAGTWHVVDYKTTRTSTGGVPQAAEPYRLQMYLYRQAVERILRTSVEGMWLVFLHPGVEFRVQFTPDEEQQLAQKWETAIDRLARDAPHH